MDNELQILKFKAKVKEDPMSNCHIHLCSSHSL
jgi:hypothetical protein